MAESSRSFIFVVENDNNKKSTRDLLWVLGIEIFSQVSSWIVFPVIVALLVGKYLDNLYGTKPYAFLGCIAFAFLISSIGIGKIVLKYAKKLNEENKENGTHK